MSRRFDLHAYRRDAINPIYPITNPSHRSNPLFAFFRLHSGERRVKACTKNQSIVVSYFRVLLIDQRIKKFVCSVSTIMTYDTLHNSSFRGTNHFRTRVYSQIVTFSFHRNYRISNILHTHFCISYVSCVFLQLRLSHKCIKIHGTTSNRVSYDSSTFCNSMEASKYLISRCYRVALHSLVFCQRYFMR